MRSDKARVQHLLNRTGSPASDISIYTQHAPDIASNHSKHCGSICSEQPVSLQRLLSARDRHTHATHITPTGQPLCRVPVAQHASARCTDRVRRHMQHFRLRQAEGPRLGGGLRELVLHLEAVAHVWHWPGLEVCVQVAAVFQARLLFLRLH